ncbi:MAG: PilZ domain-containing protein [bacterium]|nr:PilZ domain-containing protein [Myxococcales bacterium]MCB9552907.1 PilZ domain-containing protein [Myxococcales bacterium]
MSLATDRRTDRRLPLRIFVDHILAEDQRCLCVTDDVSADGVRLRGTPGHGWGNPRHVWLSFRLPDDGPAIRALGELRYEGQGDDGLRVRGYRFKYLAPDNRRRFERFLAAAAWTGEAAA